MRRRGLLKALMLLPLAPLAWLLPGPKEKPGDAGRWITFANGARLKFCDREEDGYLAGGIPNFTTDWDPWALEPGGPIIQLGTGRCFKLTRRYYLEPLNREVSEGELWRAPYGP